MKIYDDGLPASGYLSLEEVLAIMKISKTTLYAGIAAGRYPPQVKIGARRVGWDVGEIRKWMRDPEGYCYKPHKLELV